MKRWRSNTVPTLATNGAVAVAVLAVVVAVVLTVPSLTRVPARLLEGCLGWVAVATGFELLSTLGFVLVFTLAFAGGAGARADADADADAGAGAEAGAWAGLRSLAAATVLPAGGLVGPVAGALGPDTDAAAIRRLTRSSIGLVALTTAPLFIAVGVTGVMLRIGWLAGPRATLLTLLPATIAFGGVAGAWHGSRRRPAGQTPVALLRGGLADARQLALGGDWRLLGGLAYYGFDTAVLWAAFHALGQTPPLAAIVMGYVLGSLAASLPTPAGLGALEGGLVGGLVLYGAAAGPAAAAVLLYRAISLLVPLVVGGVAWGEKLTRRRAGAAAPARTCRPRPRCRQADTRR